MNQRQTGQPQSDADERGKLLHHACAESSQVYVCETGSGLMAGCCAPCLC